MFGLFKNRRDINQVIFEIAEHQRPRDHKRLFMLLRGRELFASVASSRVPLEHGRHLVVGPDDDIQLKTGRLPNGMACVVFYVDRGDARLGPQYVGITTAAAFEMASKLPIDALLIQNSQNSWVAFPKEEFAALRARCL